MDYTFENYWNEENELIAEFKNQSDYNVANFKKSFLPDFKYQLELLKRDGSDFKLLEGSTKFNSVENEFSPSVQTKLDESELHI